jgi:anti-sigma regulatory factor (Ser/Thr protein kinase)
VARDSGIAFDRARVGYPHRWVPVLITESLPKAPSSAAQARRLLDRLEGDVAPEALDSARLLVTELIANAVEHVREDGEIGVEVELRGDALFVAVSDPGPGFDPVPRRPQQPKDSGWGLHFTELLAERWGADRDGGGRVWFELRSQA